MEEEDRARVRAARECRGRVRLVGRLGMHKYHHLSLAFKPRALLLSHEFSFIHGVSFIHGLSFIDCHSSMGFISKDEVTSPKSDSKPFKYYYSFYNKYDDIKITKIFNVYEMIW